MRPRPGREIGDDPRLGHVDREAASRFDDHGSDPLGDCRTALWRVVDHGRAGGAIASAIKAFALLGFGSLLSGDWDGALRVAEEGLELTARHHYRLLGGFLQYDQAMIAAARGDDGTVRHITNDLIGWVAPGRVGFVLQLAAMPERWLSSVAATSHPRTSTLSRSVPDHPIVQADGSLGAVRSRRSGRSGWTI